MPLTAARPARAPLTAGASGAGAAHCGTGACLMSARLQFVPLDTNLSEAREPNEPGQSRA